MVFLSPMRLNEIGKSQKLYKGSLFVLLEWARISFLFLLLEACRHKVPQTTCDGTMILILEEQFCMSPLQPIENTWKSWKSFVPGLKKTQVLYSVSNIILGQGN